MDEACVLGVAIRARTRSDALAALRRMLAAGGPHSVYFVHACTANLAFENPELRAALNRGDLVLNDGIGVRLAARCVGVRLRENLVGTDLLPLLLDQEFDRPLRVYLLGGRPGVAERAAAALRLQHPGIEIAGAAHGFFTPAEEPEVVAKINASDPDLLLAAMGNPGQELFIDRNLRKLKCRVAMGVGGFLDHLSGDLRRAPRWMRRCGLEWLQLALQQPHKRRRYLAGIPKFLWRAFPVKSALVVIASVMLSVAAAEAFVRMARPQILERYPHGLYDASETRQYRLRPGFKGVLRSPEFTTTVRINRQGLRADREYGPPGPGIRRIVAAGDSFTMGYGVEESQTWVRRLESHLGPGHEVINGGVPGYATRQELLWLEEEGFSLGPETVLLGFFLGNDITDNASSELPVKLHEGRLISGSAGSGRLPLAVNLFLARRLHLFHLAWRSRRSVKPPVPEAGWVATAGLLDSMARTCARHGARLIVLLIPESGQSPGVRDRMLRLCDAAGVKSVDLAPAMAGPGLYYRQDGHWTPLGNAQAARVIFDHLSP